jgi:hypothetical protein
MHIEFGSITTPSGMEKEFPFFLTASATPNEFPFYLKIAKPWKYSDSSFKRRPKKQVPAKFSSSSYRINVRELVSTTIA